MSGKSCNGSFLFIMSAEWDYVGRRSRKRFLEDKYSISIAERPMTASRTYPKSIFE